MSERSIPMSLPLDGDGFLRRACPACQREFKWWPASTEEGPTLAVAVEPAEPFFCPYCAEPAAPGDWWTPAQRDYAMRLAQAEVLGPELRRLQEQTRRLNRRGGLIRIDLTLPPLARPEPLAEPDDLARVDFPCHPEAPIKVDEGWPEEVACLVCGLRYPVELVRALPEIDDWERR